MLSFLTKQYKIEVADCGDSIDNPAFLAQFDHVYLVSGEYRPTSAVLIRAFEGGELLKRALFGASGGGTGVNPASIVVQDDRLVGCCGDNVFCLTLPELDLAWHTRADEATCFEIFNYRDDYIVHGELEISRLDELGNIVWQRGGADIFTTPEGRDTFQLTDDHIIARDWNYDMYKFDFNGNLITG